MIELLKTLCALRGPSGREERVRDYIEAYAKPYADEIFTDPMGNLHVFRKGVVSDRTLMVCGHMDEVGLIVTGITADGYLKFDFVGGVDRRVVIGKRVWMGEHQIPGVIGVKAYHLCKGEADKFVPSVDSMYVDIGAESKEEAEKYISLGDVGCFDPDKGKPVDVPPKELELLYFLASNSNRVFTRDQLLDKVWGFDYLGDSRTVDVHVKRLREKLEGVSDKWTLKTVWGVGYKFEILN